jgi:hypothetical protein
MMLTGAALLIAAAVSVAGGDAVAERAGAPAPRAEERPAPEPKAGRERAAPSEPAAPRLRRPAPEVQPDDGCPYRERQLELLV